MPSQLAAAKILASFGYFPDISFAGSGGTVVSYIMEFSNWDWSKANDIIRSLSSDLFVAHSLVPCLGMLVSMAYGQLYYKSPHGEQFLNKLIEQGLPFNTEIWSGSQDFVERRAHFTCNMPIDQSMLCIKQRDIKDSNLHTPHYFNGDTLLVTKYIQSSYAIPLIVPPVKVEGKELSDSGMVYGSPIYSLRRSIAGIKNDCNVSMHITILTSVDLQFENPPPQKRKHASSVILLNNMCIQITAAMVANLRKDVLSAVDILIMRGLEEKGSIRMSISDDMLRILKRFKSSVPGTVLELFSNQCQTIDLVTFTPEDLLTAIKVSGDSMSARLRWFAYPNRKYSSVALSDLKELEQIATQEDIYE